MKLSLILATYGRTEELGRAIDSFAAQTDRNFELIVVDQNPDDRLRPYLDQAHVAGLDVLHEQMDRPGLSEARNRGIQLAKHDILAFPDDDCWYEPDTVAMVRRCFAEDQLRAGVIGRWVEHSGTQPPAAHVLNLESWRRFRGGNASSITMFIRRSLFAALGGFDERFGVGKWYGAAEETDFILRALADGAHIEYRPEVRVHHHYSTKPAGAWRAVCRNARMRGRGTGAIWAKHHLDAYVVLRGLVSPLMRGLARFHDSRLLLSGLMTPIGRLEGYLRWKFRES